MTPPAAAVVRSDEPGVAMSEVLARVADELAQLAALAQTLQVTLSPVLAMPGQSAVAAQDLDALTQRIEGLCTFVACLGEQCPPSWRPAPAEAAATLGLHAQKLRLVSPAVQREEAPGAGTLELFLWTDSEIWNQNLA